MKHREDKSGKNKYDSSNSEDSEEETKSSKRRVREIHRFRKRKIRVEVNQKTKRSKFT